MKHSLKLYQSKFAGKRFSLILANGDKIQLFFTRRALAHILGLKYSYLAEQPLFEGLSSYQCLEYMIYHTEEVLNEIMNDNLVVEEMFSPELGRKNLSIERTPILGNGILKQITFVCPYDKRLHSNPNKKPIQTDYLIGIPNEENDMSLFGVIQDKESGHFRINTNLLVLNGENYFQELRDIISNQTLTYVSCANIYDYNRDVEEPKLVYLQEKDKLLKLEVLKYYQQKANSRIDTTAETERQLNEILKLKEFKLSTNDFVRLLKERIEAREEIPNEYGSILDPNYRELASLTNELIQKMNALESFADDVLKASQTYEKRKNKF